MKNTFTLAHVGVNTENAEEALALAEPSSPGRISSA